jgi:sugar/nucleoside kinase (ribokinase family)
VKSGKWFKARSSSIRPNQIRPDRKTLFFDLCDPQKRPNEDILEALNLIAGFQPYFSVTLGLNEKEAHEIGEVLGLKAESDSMEGLMALVEQLHQHIKADTLVVHPVKYAVASNRSEVVSINGPFIPNPVITTGAGDHFNAGFCLGRLLNLNHQESLATGVATSGFYVRSGKSPTVLDLADMLENWPE